MGFLQRRFDKSRTDENVRAFQEMEERLNAVDLPVHQTRGELIICPGCQYGLSLIEQLDQHEEQRVLGLPIFTCPHCSAQFK